MDMLIENDVLRRIQKISAEELKSAKSVAAYLPDSTDDDDHQMLALRTFVVSKYWGEMLRELLEMSGMSGMEQESAFFMRLLSKEYIRLKEEQS
jgi:hypothetical protein